MMRTLIRLTVLAAILFGSIVAASNELRAGGACCYSDCMQFCTQQHSFNYCHNKCNRDCDACQV
jgi:hypothetical protein